MNRFVDFKNKFVGIVVIEFILKHQLWRLRFLSKNGHKEHVVFSI